MLDNYQKAKIEADASAMKGIRALKAVNATSEEVFGAFIALNDANEVPTDRLESLGVTITGQTGQILTAQIPLSAFEKVAALDAVKSVSLAKTLKIKNDKARGTTNVTQVHAGTSLNQPYTGKGVIVGIIDTGIDYNHINFKDSNGNSRVVSVFQPQTSGSTTVNGVTIPGKAYTTAAEIAALTTDETNASHGSHVSGIAGGSYSTNGYQGMAPGADLVLCGLGSSLRDDYILNAVKYVFNYAQSVGKPAVVNLSLGGHDGPHDGTSSLCVALDNLAQAGHIVVLASSNEGGSQLYLHKKFTATTDAQITTLISNNYNGYSGIYSNDGDATTIDCWSRTSARFGVQFFVIDNMKDSIVATSSKFYPSNDNNTGFTWDSSSDTKFGTYYSGSVKAYAGLQSQNNKYEIYIMTSASPAAAKNYQIGIRYFGDEGTEIDCWDTDGYNDFSSGNITGYSNGNDTYSVNEMATGFNTLSIGAYCSRSTFPSVDGGTYKYSSFTLGNIAYFSSYGVDVNGHSHPDVAAPGAPIVSSVNEYEANTTSNADNTISAVYKDSARSYHWGVMMGTSMASPCAAGIVALWLQAKPSLTVADIRSVLQSTSIKDSYVNAGNSVQWGAGKIDALNGIVQILNSGINDVTVKQGNMLVFPNPSDGHFTVYAQNETEGVSINIFSVNGQLVFSQVGNPAGGIINVDASGALAPGMYLVKVNGKKSVSSSRLIIK